MQKRPNINIRFDTKTQVERIRRAAKLRKWSFNKFVVDAAEGAADLELTKVQMKAEGMQFADDAVATN